MGHGRLAVACAVTVLAALVSGVVVTTGPSLAASCATLAPGPDATRVMVAGDSLTQGSSGDWTWRYRLWQHLVAGGVDVDFVGPFDFVFDNLTSDAFGGGQAYADPCFDQDHYALGGATYTSLLAPPTVSPSSSSGIGWAVSTYRPDVVVQLAGANDLHQGASVDEVLTRAKACLDEIRGANPRATVVMVTLPTTQMPDVVPEYNSRLAELVPTWSTTDSPVVLADAMRDWAGSADTWDGWHPNARGEMHIAADIEDAFAAIGLGAPAERPIPDVPLGPRVAPVLSAEPGHGAVALSWVSPPGADREYAWYRDVTGGGAWTPIAPAVRTAGVTVAPLEDGHEYAFRVQAAKGTALATDLSSNVVDATPTPAPASTGAVPGPTARPRVSRTPGHRLRVHWSAAAGATRYLVQLRRAGGAWRNAAWTTATHWRTGRLHRGVRYAVRIQPWHVRVPGYRSAARWARAR